MWLKHELQRQTVKTDTCKNSQSLETYTAQYHAQGKEKLPKHEQLVFVEFIFFTIIKKHTDIKYDSQFLLGTKNNKQTKCIYITAREKHIHRGGFTLH